MLAFSQKNDDFKLSLPQKTIKLKKRLYLQHREYRPANGEKCPSQWQNHFSRGIRRGDSFLKA